LLILHRKEQHKSVPYIVVVVELSLADFRFREFLESWTRVEPDSVDVYELSFLLQRINKDIIS